MQKLWIKAIPDEDFTIKFKQSIYQSTEKGKNLNPYNILLLDSTQSAKLHYPYTFAFLQMQA